MYNFLNKISVKEITEIITFDSPKGRIKEIKEREYYGLSFCTEGQITYTLNGAQYVSNKSCAVVLPQGQSYILHGDKKGIFPVINFLCHDFLCDEIVVIPIENIHEYIKEYEKMKSLFLFEKNRTKIISMFYNIIYHLYRDATQGNHILAPAVKYIENNYFDPTLTNKTLSELSGISEVYFRKLFLEKYSTTPKQFVIDIRLEKAKQLLTDGVLKINAISEECGFANPYHFCRLFKQKCGISPTEYMKRNKVYKI